MKRRLLTKNIHKNTENQVASYLTNAQTSWTEEDDF